MILVLTEMSGSALVHITIKNLEICITYGSRHAQILLDLLCVLCISCKLSSLCTWCRFLDLVSGHRPYADILQNAH
jgi:hypothetical protein